MSTSDEDHNYYSQSFRRSRLPDYNVDASQSPASHVNDDLPLLPALHYRQSQQYPKRPTVTTNFDHYATNSQLHIPLDDPSAADASPDPLEFYRPFRESFRRESGSVYGGFGIDNGQREEGMSSTLTSHRAPAFSSRVNGHGSAAAARWSSRIEEQQLPQSGHSDRSHKAATPGTQAPRGRQSSLQALVNKFNQTPDEIPPVPTSRSTSANASPSSLHAAKSFKARTASETPKSRQAAKGQTNSRDVRSKTPISSEKRRHTSKTPESAESNSRRLHKPSAVANNTFATQSMTDLAFKDNQGHRKPLFGEVLTNGEPDIGYGIPSLKIRRGSEGSVYQPSSMFHDHAPIGARKVSPSSPTAWYMGVTPSLEGIDFDKPFPEKRPDMHRRSRSDIVAGHFAMPPKETALNKPFTVLSPTIEQYSPDSSPTQPKRQSQSRIPISSRRRSATSDSGSTNPSRPGSTMGHYPNHRKAPAKSGGHIPKPIETKTPDRKQRSTTPRKSPRRYDPSPPRQPSPRLQAFISEPPAAKSPPLRSSRPRQPVSTATTSASRARAAANLPQASRNRDKNGKPLPELGGVDFAARREFIQRAFTTKVKEKEIETERKRMSLLQDAQWQNERNRDSIAQSSCSDVPATAPAHQSSFDNLQRPEEELFTVKHPAKSREEPDLAIKVTPSSNLSALQQFQEDSPTLGTAQFLEPVRYDGSEPSSAQTSATAETFFESEVHPSDPLSSTSKQQPASAEQKRESRPSAHRFPSNNSKFGTVLYGSDQEDAESIHIMLQDANSDNKKQLSEPAKTHVSNNENIGEGSWGTGSLRRKDSPTLQRISEDDRYRDQNEDAHASLSTNASTYNSNIWSPESTSTAHTARDSDTYNTINHVLDDYHDSSFMNSDRINEFQQRLFAQSPGIARQGNWDPQKVTQLYLQNYARERPSHSTSLSDTTETEARASGKEVSDERLQPQDERSQTQFVESGNPEDQQPEVVPPDQNVHESLKAPDTFSHRASASLTNADDWLNTSPSMLDWMAHQQLDTPVEEKGEKSFSFNQQSSSSSSGEKELPSFLPGIPPSGGLGIDITIQSPNEGPPGVQTSHAHPDPKARRPSPLSTDSIPRPESPTLRSSTPASGAASKYSTKSGSLASHEDTSRKNSEENIPRLSRPRAGTEPGQISMDASSVAESSRSSVTPAEQKRLNRRRHILKELVDTEASFGRDMTVVVDIYKGTSNVILNSPEDVRVLFGNAADIVQFSQTFLDSLKQAVKSVYVLPREKRWKKRESSATTGSTTTTDDQSSLSGIDLSDEDKDRMTSIGASFDTHLTQMEKVYTEYLKNHDAANQKLQQLQKSEKVKIWLKECRAYAHDLTTAWDLDSLLVKPVQRILKYPLLLKELQEVTPENHPDFVAIDTAAREMVGVSVRINEAKKRADLIEQVNNSTSMPAKDQKKSREGRDFPMVFGRRKEKFKQQVGVTESVQDRTYDALSEKFGSHFFQLQVVMRDCEMYVVESTSWVNKFNEMLVAIEAYLDVGQTSHPEIESRWRRFRLSVKEIQMTALTDHITAVRSHVIEPMTTLLKIHDGPQKLMEKRKKRVMDYAKYKTIKDRGEKMSKAVSEQGEQFIAVNETLKEELPKLFSLTAKLVEACLQNFVQLQLQWMNVWRAKLRNCVDSHEIPPSFVAILDEFKADFGYTDAQVVSLGLCNGSLVADHANLVNFSISPSSTSYGGSTLMDDPSRRPSMATDEGRSRTTSSATLDPHRSRGLSINHTNSPVIPQPDFGRPTDGFGLQGMNTVPYNPSSYAQVQGRRIRASSTASSRSPLQPDNNAGWRHQGGSSSANQPSRPSTSTAYSYESSGLTRPSYDSGRPSNDRLDPDEAMRYGQRSPNRQSTVFSSAMPMSDSPRAGSPTKEVQSPSEFNILFLAASVYEFNIDRARREAGYPYLTYVAGEVFDVIGEKGELWLAKNQDDRTNQVGWIWSKHFAKLAT